MAENRENGVSSRELEIELHNNGRTDAHATGVNPITVTFDSGRSYTIDSNGNIKEVGTGENPDENPTEGVRPGEIVEATEKENYTDSEGNKATVPAGFVVSEISEEQKVSTGLVIYDIPEDELESVDWTTKNEDGAYNVQTLYNQFVWIPVAEGEYERDFSYPSYYDEPLENTPAGSTFTDTGYLPEGIQGTDDAESNETAERNAVMKYNGFYIARYEAGIDTDGTTVISKQDADVYNTNVTQTDLKEDIAKSMYNSSNSSSVKSAMCSGIQWDMVMKFVDGKKDAKGNLYDVRVYDDNRHTEWGVTNSGKNEYDKVQNLYDLEGNCFEYIAEKNNSSYPLISRGGFYAKESDWVASIRYGGDDSSNTYNFTFRPALYIM